LAKTGAVSERQGKQAESNAEAQAAVVASSRRRVEAAKATLSAARALLSNPQVRGFEAAGVQEQIGQANADVAASQAEASRARAQLEEARANRADLRITAPFAGTIATRAAEPGEFANVGAPLVTIVDLSKVYLRGYVPGGEIGKVRVDQIARVFIDSAPNRPLQAVVSRIDPEAAFTPENTYFREERVKQVVGVKLHLKEGFGYAKPGMPADGQILTQGTAWPTNAKP
jgi:HlyD family secretion protein